MMKLKNLFLTIALAASATAAMAQTNGFSYQAVVRDSKGELVSNKPVGLRVTLVDSTGQSLYQQELRPSTNAYGVLSVTVGSNDSTLLKLNWAAGVQMRVEIDPTGGANSTNLGPTPIQAVPYALYAANGGQPGPKGEKGDPGIQGPAGPQGPKGDDGMKVEGSEGQTLVHNGTTWVATDQLSVKKLDVKGSTSEDALFEVKDKDGNVVFAVYPNQVHVYVDEDDTKAKRSGLIVTGRAASKTDVQRDYLVVDPEGTHVFIDPNSTNKAKRSGFVVTGRTATKDDAANNDFFAINADGTHVYVDTASTDKAKRSGFVVTGRTATKNGATNDFLAINGQGTQVFVDDELEDAGKAKRSGFVVTGRTATKDETPTNYLKVATNGTMVHFDKTKSKAKRSGLVVTGRTATKGTDDEYFTINTDSTRFYINGGNSKGNLGVAGLAGGANESGNGGFAVSGRNGVKDGEPSNLFNIDLSQDAKVIKDENRIYWYPEKNAFMAGNLMVNSADSVGENSFSTGYQSKAVGNYSQAMGFKTMATGETSTAIGNKAQATGQSSFAFGKKTEAKAENSVAIGNTAKATKKNSYALGMNCLADGEGSYAFGDSATAKGLGSFAMGRSSVIKDTTYKDDRIDKIITNKFEPPVALGNYAYSIGTGTKASAEGSFAMGIDNRATAKYAVAFGRNNTSQALSAIAFGKDNNASGSCAVALGIGNTVTKENGVAIGFGNTVTNGNSTAIGFTNTANGGWSTALGRLATTEAYYSVAIGFNATAKSPSEVVVGTWNDEEGATTGHVDSDSPNSRAFVVGSGWEAWSNGKQTINRRNALVVLRNGDMAVTGNITYKSSCQPSDIRLKKDVQQLNGALDKVLKLRGVSYYWKNSEEMTAVRGKEVYGYDDKKHIGVIAQEVEEVLPELVVTDNEGFKAVKYENIAPVLIEAVKEQQAIIEGLESKVEKLEKLVEELLKKQ